MTQPDNAQELLGFWRKQIDEGARAWTNLVEQRGQSDPSALWRPVMDEAMASWGKLFTEGPITPDMQARWKSFLDQWIKAWSAALEEAMGTEAFAKAMGQTLDHYLDAQGPLRKSTSAATEETLGALGLPSRTQLSGLAHQVGDLDDRVDELEDAIATVRGRIEELDRTLAKRLGDLGDKLGKPAGGDGLDALTAKVDRLAERIDKALAAAGGQTKPASTRSSTGKSGTGRSGSTKSAPKRAAAGKDKEKS
jgi:poly(hydroxyalkanoate) synthase III subunit E